MNTSPVTLKKLSAAPDSPAAGYITQYADSNGDIATVDSAGDTRKIPDINAQTSKTTPVAADIVLIEDSEDSYSKKKITINQINISSSLSDSAFSSAWDGETSLGPTQNAVYDIVTERGIEDGISSITFDGQGVEAYYSESDLSPAAGVSSLLHFNGDLINYGAASSGIPIATCNFDDTAKWGGRYSLDFVTSGYVVIPEHVSMTLSPTGSQDDFYIGCAVYFHNIAGTQTIAGKKWEWRVEYDNSSGLVFRWGTTGAAWEYDISCLWNPVISTWYNIGVAYDHSELEVHFIVNGVIIGTIDVSATSGIATTDTAFETKIGSTESYTNFLLGQVDEFIVIKGSYVSILGWTDASTPVVRTVGDEYYVSKHFGISEFSLAEISSGLTTLTSGTSGELNSLSSDLLALTSDTSGSINTLTSGLDALETWTSESFTALTSTTTVGGSLFSSGQIGVNGQTIESPITILASNRNNYKIRLVNDGGDDADAGISVFSNADGTAAYFGANSHFTSLGALTRDNATKPSCGINFSRYGRVIMYSGGAGATCVEGASLTSNSEFRIYSVIDDANAGPILDIYRNSASAADLDNLGKIKFSGNNNAGSPENIVYADIYAQIFSKVDGDEEGTLFIRTINNGVEGDSKINLTNGTFELVKPGATPSINIYRNKADGTATNGDAIGQRVFYGKNDANEKITMFYEYVTLPDVQDGNEDAKCEWYLRGGGSLVIELTLTDNLFHVTGEITAGTKTFCIDHPLDPENKFLKHSVIESPEMRTVYYGRAQLDAGRAVVILPDWWTALNGADKNEYNYQLTCIGGNADVWIESEVTDNQFTIGGDRDILVSWQISAIRHDAFAEANRVVVEVDKDPVKYVEETVRELEGDDMYEIVRKRIANPMNSRGRYIHPEVRLPGLEAKKYFEPVEKSKVKLSKVGS